MATTVYNTEEIELSDGSSVTLKPLSIKKLRLFMAKMKEWEGVVQQEGDDTEIRAIEILAQAATICLSDQKPEWLEDPEQAEDVLDMDTIFKVVEICGGMKLNDPNLIQAAREAQIRAAAGTN